MCHVSGSACRKWAHGTMVLTPIRQGSPGVWCVMGVGKGLLDLAAFQVPPKSANVFHTWFSDGKAIHAKTRLLNAYK